METLTLEWIDGGQIKTQIIQAQQPSKHPGTVRVGRDRNRCDLVLSDPTVSGLHVEIFFNHQEQCFYLRNLRESNPPTVDGYSFRTGEVALKLNSTIILGQQPLRVTHISQQGSNIPATILVSSSSNSAPHQAAFANQPPQQQYGLKCPKCDRISLYEWQETTCLKCGTNLAQAWSVLITPAERSWLEQTKKPYN